MKNLLKRIKFLFTKAVFKGENTRMEFFVYHFLVGLFFIVPASTYLKLENTPTDLANLIYLLLSTVSLLLGIYLLSVNIIRRANKTTKTFWGGIGVVALLINQLAPPPFQIFYPIVAIILLLSPDRNEHKD